ncbi:MAG: xanthine/uracil permease, partial [Oscillospiraceae bacterium]|nr:xanthine/uracil permease [Oscillospiraceae bacterium]
ISVDMCKQTKRTGAISFIAALATYAFCRHFSSPGEHLFNYRLIYVVAVSVTLATLDFVLLQKDPETGKRGRRVNISAMAKADGYVGDMEQNDNPKFWTKEYWADFKLMKPKFNLYAIYFALAFISLNIGTNIAFGNITAGMGPRDAYGVLLNPQNMDYLTVINSLADIPSILFGGAPVGAIISATAAAPWPVIAGVVMMLLCALLLLLGLMTKAVKYIPVQAVAGFLFIIGFFSTFVPNLSSSFVPGYTAQASASLAVTAITKNPFFGLVAGVAVRYIGSYFGL